MLAGKSYDLVTASATGDSRTNQHIAAGITSSVIHIVESSERRSTSLVGQIRADAPGVL